MLIEGRELDGWYFAADTVFPIILDERIYWNLPSLIDARENSSNKARYEAMDDDEFRDEFNDEIAESCCGKNAVFDYFQENAGTLPYYDDDFFIEKELHTSEHEVLSCRDDLIAYLNETLQNGKDWGSGKARDAEEFQPWLRSFFTDGYLAEEGKD